MTQPAQPPPSNSPWKRTDTWGFLLGVLCSARYIQLNGFNIETIGYSVVLILACGSALGAAKIAFLIKLNPNFATDIKGADRLYVAIGGVAVLMASLYAVLRLIAPHWLE